MDLPKLVREMTLKEKVSLLSGKTAWQTKNIDRLGIPSILLSDGPHGLRKEYPTEENGGINPSYPATCYPTAVLTACSFDKDLLEQMGEAIAKECIAHHVDVLLGPGVNIKRSPLCGRNFEYFSEDPYLSGEMGAAFVRGVQRKNIGTSVKHFVANNQETYRQIVSSEIDERALREIYLLSFERVVKEKPYTIMSSYNRVNGTHTGENREIAKVILRDEWGYEGVMVSDWGACFNRVDGIKASLDLEMPHSNGLYDEAIIEAVQNGSLKEEVIDESVIRLLTLIEKCQVEKKEEAIDSDMAQVVAVNSMVLLKNEDGILPLNKSKKIAIIGEMAKKPRYQGSGSSRINPIKLENVYDNIDTPFVYAKGYHIDRDEIDEILLKEAIEIAKQVDTVVLFIGLTDIYESEGYDRTHLRLPHSHNVLVEEVAKVNPNVVVVLAGGAPVLMPWIHEVKGLLNSYLAGESGGKAIVDLLFGHVNPSGKLAETYPLKLEDTPSVLNFPGNKEKVYYEESIYVGYRYYEKKNQEVLFPFGFGLSYTTFKYDGLTFAKKEYQKDEEVTLTFTITNTGSVEGKEIYQIYVKDIESSVFKPIKELKEFGKVSLKPNETKDITVTLTSRTFSYYNVDLKEWCVEPGAYEILIASSSVDIRLKETIHIVGEEIPCPYNPEEIPTYYDLSKGFKSEEFEVLLKRNVNKTPHHQGKPFTLNSTLDEMRKTLMGKILIHMGHKEIRSKNHDKVTVQMLERSLLELPLRTVISFSGMKFTQNKIQGLLYMINGKWIKGIRLYLRRKKE